jgi:hypothetical protein
MVVDCIGGDSVRWQQSTLQQLQQAAQLCCLLCLCSVLCKQRSHGILILCLLQTRRQLTALSLCNQQNRASAVSIFLLCTLQHGAIVAVVDCIAGNEAKWQQPNTAMSPTNIPPLFYLPISCCAL